MVEGSVKRAMLKDFARKCLYASGALGFYHRARNADSLTVMMFHRTLRAADPRSASCDPDYSLDEDLFVASLAFFKRHYHVVSLDELLRARRDDTRLPSRALLITFDDGWLDNVDYAMPALQRAGLPAVMFVAADAVGARQPFYQERVIAAWRLGRLTLDALVATMIDHGGEAAHRDGIAGVRELIAQLEKMPPAQRSAVLEHHAGQLDDGLQHMIAVPDLSRLRAGGIELGLHGKTHTPLLRADDLDAELGGAREAMAAMLDAPEGLATPACATMSFPHGAFDDAIAARARATGYELLFTSVPVLNAVGARPSWLLGRTGYETDTVVDRHGRFRPERLAWYLFRRATQRLRPD
ncbi:MAG: polysaccharide deacetylase family protein [Lysobacter sp.]|nr:polysaccharide deacetylase family protein [Lysobacter sp.]